jgi:hypothetical protein
MVSARKLWMNTTKMTRLIAWRKISQEEISAIATIEMKKSKENSLNGFLTLSARPGKVLFNEMPTTKGIPRMMNTVKKTSAGLKLTCFKIGAVAGLRLPHIERFSGVIKMAAILETAVILIDMAELPLARYVTILERFPPGQAATKIIPNAMEGVSMFPGNIIVNKKVKAGSIKNWAAKPITGALGDLMMRLKSSNFKSRATPNIITPIARLIINSNCGLKFSLT